MSITYEEALATLEAMFGAPWTRESLDVVLRHEKGHMENTCEKILNHGSKDPLILVKELTSDNKDSQISVDEELARQLAGGSEVPQQSVAGKPTKSAAGQKIRGIPTTLPPDFLRIPGYKPSISGDAAKLMEDDEKLARMLQDELFSQELARNPDFAHLARGRRGQGARQQARSSNSSNRNIGELIGLPGATPRKATPAEEEGPNIMEKISELGESAKRNLAMFAAQFEQRLNKTTQSIAGTTPAPAGVDAERRGLLDEDDEQTIEFEMRKNK